MALERASYRYFVSWSQHSQYCPTDNWGYFLVVLVWQGLTLSARQQIQDRHFVIRAQTYPSATVCILSLYILLYFRSRCPLWLWEPKLLVKTSPHSGIIRPSAPPESGSRNAINGAELRREMDRWFVNNDVTEILYVSFVMRISGLQVM